MSDREMIERLCAARLALDEAIAVLRARQPVLNGSGRADPHEYDAMLEAHNVAVELTRRTGVKHLLESVGDGRWKVIRGEETPTNGGNHDLSQP